MIAPHLWATCCERHYYALRMEIDMWPTPKLISECRPNSNFSANHEDNENDQKMKLIQAIKMKVTTQRTNTCSTSTIEKKFSCLYGYLWTYFTPCSSVFRFRTCNCSLVFFHYKYQTFMCYMHRKSYFSYKFFKECSHYSKIHRIDLSF